MLRVEGGRKLAFWGSLVLLGLGCQRREPPRADARPAPASSLHAPAPAPRPLLVDVHVHLSPLGIERLLGLMKRYGFDHAVNLSGGTPREGLPIQLRAAQTAQGKVTVFASLAYEEAEHADYGERMAEALRVSHRMGARGLKIAKVLGLALRDSRGKLIAVDEPELDPVFETAAELGMPIAIHTGDPKAFWQPVDQKNERQAELRAHPAWALHGKDVPSFEALLAQLERRVARHPKASFIAVHFGNCAEDPAWVARALRKYPNLFIDTAARIPEMGRHAPERMRAFFVEFQDRILFGSDLGVGPEDTPLFLGSEGSEPPTEKEERLFFSATRRYFETDDRDFAHPTPIQGAWKISGVRLPPDVLAKVYGKNAVRLLKLQLAVQR
jgi:predicted TIM-barrel fold metal-dependent hydrolase